MPQARRKSAQPRNAQPTLSFNSKPTKVTKPAIPDASIKKASKAEPALVKAIIEDASTSEAVLQQEVKVESIKAKDETTMKAERIPDAQIKKYWKKEEDVRKAPRVHQQDLDIHEKILRHFDLCSQYGPCIGIPRERRWRRANSLGLNPPIEVLAVLVKEEDKAKGREWTGQRAYLDELMSSRYIID